MFPVRTGLSLVTVWSITVKAYCNITKNPFYNYYPYEFQDRNALEAKNNPEAAKQQEEKAALDYKGQYYQN